MAYFGEISSEEHGWPREEKAASFPNKFSHFKEEHIKKLQSEHVNTILIWGEQHTAGGPEPCPLDTTCRTS